jgi:hypothetical protein
MVKVARVLALVFTVALAGCAAIIGLGDDRPPRDTADAAPSTEASTPTDDASSPIDASDANDASDDAGSGPFHALDQPALWSLTDITATIPLAFGYSGLVFDGRYLYFVPHSAGTGHSGVVVRYDTQGSWAAATSFASFDIASVAPAAKGFGGAVFDGRYIYFSPFAYAAPHGNVVRYDTQATFGSASSWTIYDLDAASGGLGLRGFIGATFDGRYVYFAPYAKDANGAAPTGFFGRTLRYDTQGPFSTWSSWTVFDTTSIDVNARGFRGTIFDGRYVYLVPSEIPAVVMRYDTQLPAFDSASSWTAAPLAPLVGATAVGFYGAVFDGHYVYFVPYRKPGEYQSTIVRLDTLTSFGSAASWKAVDTRKLHPDAAGFISGAFDGRHVYFSPYSSNSRVVRFDTLGTFDEKPTAWSLYATKPLGGSIFEGAAFDGHYIYFAAGQSNKKSARFDAREAPWVKPAPIQRASFY